MQFQAIRYSLSILYRVLLAFVIGYVCTYFFTINLTNFFAEYLPKAEAIFLAAFIAILFYLAFVLMSFSIQTLKKLSAIATACLLVLFLLSRWIA